MKKKILALGMAWGESTVDAFLSGAREAFESIEADMYFFTNFSLLTDSESYIGGETNVFMLAEPEEYDGVLILGNTFDLEGVFDELFGRCKKAGIPIVTTGQKRDGAFFVGLDNKPGMRELSEHLINEHNARDIVFIAGARNHPDSNERRDTLAAVMSEHGLTLDDDHIIYTGWNPSGASEYLNEIGAGKRKAPDVFVCANDIIAMAVATRMEDLGYAVPEDVKVTGFDNLDLAMSYRPSIASVNPDFFKIGFESGKALLALMDGKDIGSEKMVPSRFVASESCGCMKSHDFGRIRGEAGRERFLERMRGNIFERKVIGLEKELFNSNSYQSIKDSYATCFQRDHSYEGEVLHLIVDNDFVGPEFDIGKVPRNIGYGRQMNVVFSYDHGDICDVEEFNRKNIVPHIKDIGTNRCFMIIPLHEDRIVIGYIVFGDSYEKITSATTLSSYANRLSLLLGRIRQNMILSIYNAKLQRLNETDALTSVKSRLAFEKREAEINEMIVNKSLGDMALALFDINNLKGINDMFGHERGDRYIVKSCKLLCEYFKKSPIFRIGGDEFIAILQGTDYENRFNIVKELHARMKEMENEDLMPEERVSVAIGVARYNKSKDKSVKDIFVRADFDMYKDKRRMKSGRNIR